MVEPLSPQATEVDGVPVFWADLGEAHDTLCLLFRVGQADERFTRIGLTHLVEHLALNTVGPQPYSWNGFVDLTFCGFHATGQPDELVDFAARVCAALRALPPDRLEHETRVLRTEAEGRGRGPFQRLLWYRFGAQRYGLSGLPEWALWTAGMAEIQAWATARFNRRNAALWYGGRLPAGLRLDLPEGERLAPAEAVLIDPLPLPSVVEDVPGGVAVGSLCRRSSAMTLAAALVTQQATARLRLERGIARQVDCLYCPLTAELAHVAFSVPALAEHTDEVSAGLVEVLQGMAEAGPEPETFERTKEQGRRVWADRWITYSTLDWRARESLVSRRVQGVEELVAEAEGVTPEMVRAGVAEALTSAILLVPPNGRKPAAPFRDYPNTSTEAIVRGVRYVLNPSAAVQPTGWRRWFGWTPPPPEYPRLLIGEDGVMLALAPGRQVTVRRDGCAGYVVGKQGARTAYGLDGFNVHVVGEEWVDGDQAIRDLDALFPEQCRIVV